MARRKSEHELQRAELQDRIRTVVRFKFRNAERRALNLIESDELAKFDALEPGQEYTLDLKALTEGIDSL